MSGNEEEAPSLDDIAKLLDDQRRTQQTLQQRLENESNARFNMETQLGNMEKLLQTLVGRQITNSSVNTATTTSVTQSSNTINSSLESSAATN